MRAVDLNAATRVIAATHATRDDRPPRRPTSASASKARVNSANRPPTATNKAASSSTRPVKHEPCSTSMAKFHESLNNSLLAGEQGHHAAAAHPPPHPIIEAKRKFRYMTNPKSFVDESLFGNVGTVAQQQHMGESGQSRPMSRSSSGAHLTHNFMSNKAPLLVSAAPASSRPDSARSTAQRSESATPRPQSARQQQQQQQTLAKYQQPWRP